MKTDGIDTIKTRIYLDYQATTPLDKRVIDKMLPYMNSKFGNPHSSEHSYGWESEQGVAHAIRQIAEYIGAIDDEIILTSGATESNNLAIIGIAYTAQKKFIRKKTILVSAIEHKCVLGSSRFLEEMGFCVKKIPVNKEGIIDINTFNNLITDDVLLVSIMATNNEIGTNQPISEIGKICKEREILFHTDAAQGGYANLNVIENNVDFMSLSAHKIYGPKGIGALFISKDSILKPTPLIYGGDQQFGYRSGTVPTFLAVGFGEAAEIMMNEKEAEMQRLKNLRDELFATLASTCPQIKINGDMKNRHPGNLNLFIPNIESKRLIYSLQPNLAFSTGSACTSGIIEPSHVLKAIGLTTDESEHSFRITIGRYTTLEEVKKASNIILNALL